MNYFTWGLIACVLSVFIGFKVGCYWQAMICRKSDEQVRTIYKNMVKDIEVLYQKKYDSFVEEVRIEQRKQAK